HDIPPTLVIRLPLAAPLGRTISTARCQCLPAGFIIAMAWNRPALSVYPPTAAQNPLVVQLTAFRYVTTPFAFTGGLGTKARAHLPFASVAMKAQLSREVSW